MYKNAIFRAIFCTQFLESASYYVWWRLSPKNIFKKDVKNIILRIVRLIGLVFFIDRDNWLCEDVVTFPVTVLHCSELQPRQISWQRLWNVIFLPVISCTYRKQNLIKNTTTFIPSGFKCVVEFLMVQTSFIESSLERDEQRYKSHTQ